MTTPTPKPGLRPAQELGRFLEIQNLGLNLPFLLAFAAVAFTQAPSLRSLLLVLVAFLAGRNAGHSFNRWIDRDLDATNPRTQDRALVRGRYSSAFALTFTGANAAILLVAAFLLNPLAAVLGPLALVLVLGYSLTKRFTALTTIFLGLVEAMVPAGVFIAFTGTLPPTAWLAVAAILLWGTAFETVHSLGEVDTDRKQGLFSIPARLGPRDSVRFLILCHAAALILLGVFGWFEGLGLPYLLGVAAMAVGTGYLDRRLVGNPGDVRTVFRGHFVLGAIYLAATLAGVIVRLFAG